MVLDLEVIRRAFCKHQAAHVMSRLLTNGTEDKDINDGIPIVSQRKTV